MREKIQSLEQKSGAADFWQNREQAEQTLSTLKRLRGTYDPWWELKSGFQEVKELFDLAVEEDDESVAQEISESIGELKSKFEQLKLLVGG